MLPLWAFIDLNVAFLKISTFDFILPILYNSVFLAGHYVLPVFGELGVPDLIVVGYFDDVLFLLKVLNDYFVRDVA